jgi:hypothetical protein
MNEELSKLFWALPLVLAIGGGMLLLLGRLVPACAAKGAAERLRSIETHAVSESTLVHLLELDGCPILLLESTRNVTVHARFSARASDRPGRPSGLGRLLGLARPGSTR